MGARTAKSEFRHLKVLLKFSLREAASGSESLKDLFLAQAARIESKIELLREKAKQKRQNALSL